ncbi:hypothetical protein BDZ91DRAFT_796254 [Kalaharituber pfeilii]|nr:hypothetical protein BDZ91DRAFT_796254 [Kalaharituber pfeilii]
MRKSGLDRILSTTTEPTPRYLNRVNSSANINVDSEHLGLRSPEILNPSTPQGHSRAAERTSLESITSYHTIVTDYCTVKRAFSTTSYFRMKSRTLSLRNPLFRRARTPSADSMNSMPVSIGTMASSTFSVKSKKLLAKVPKFFEFELRFGSIRIHRVTKTSHGFLSRRHRKPSTLDFRCIGMVNEDEYYYGEAQQTAPRIHWVKPDIHSDWKKDWFKGVC